MEKSNGIQYFDLDRLCTEAVERNFRGDGNTVGSVISQATYALTWAAFTKWCNSQIEQQLAVNMLNFGVVGFQPLPYNKKVVYIRLNDNFLNMHGLDYNEAMDEFESQATIVLGPRIKPMFAQMAKSANMEKGAFHQTLLNLFQLIGELLAECQNVEIDLADFGKFQGIGGSVMYAPMNSKKPQGLAGKQTVKGLMDAGPVRGGKLPPMELSEDQRQSFEQMQQQYQAQFQYSSGSQGLYGMLFKNQKPLSDHQIELHDSPTRRFNKPYNESKVTSEMLGAGDDPMSKHQEFSLLANDPYSLMSMNFKKPSKAGSRFPPVIDPFSRTLAAPVSSQRHYLSVCHRIGTNYTQTGKGFYIDVDTRVVRYKDIHDSGTKLEIVSDRDIEPADEAEEYEAVLYPQNCDPRRIKARRVSYNRYRQYVENEISVDVIAPIRQYWLTHIIELIPGDLHAVEKDRIEYLIDTMLNEINKDYFDSVRKSILDYILKDEMEMRRLGIQQVLNQPITWGDDYYKGIEPNEEWKHNVMMARMLMSENLCICSQATLELMNIWREEDYCNTLLVNIPPPEDQPVPLEQFKKSQEDQIDIVRTKLNTDWSKSAVDILREELENLDKDQTKTFFDSVAALMSNQVRDLTRRSIDAYVNFFRRFKKEAGRYPTPEEIIAREYDPDTQFEQTFLTLRLEIKNQSSIEFQFQLGAVREELVDIVPLMVTKGVNKIPRADTQIANSDKTHLWDIVMSEHDRMVQDAKDEIEEILNENLAAAQQATRIYKDFEFLLQEDARINDFLEKRPYQREEFLAEITKYQDTIKKIKSECPFEIRMSMFLIECHQLNNALVTVCEELIMKILKVIDQYVYIDEQNRIKQQVADIQQNFGMTVESTAETKKLVEMENFLEDVKGTKEKEIVNAYEDLIEWMMLLMQFPQLKGQEESSKALNNCYNLVEKIFQSIELREESLKTQRDDIYNLLQSDIKSFKEQLNDCQAHVNDFKERKSTKIAEVEKNVQSIEEIYRQLASLQGTMDKIREQQNDLQLNVEDYPVLQSLKTQIKPYKELWELALNKIKNLKKWQDDPLCQLDPDVVEKDHKTCLQTANRLKKTFGNLKISKPESMASDILDAFMSFRVQLPIIRHLNSDGLQRGASKNKFWAQINNLLGIKEEITQEKRDLQTLKDYKGLESYVQQLEEIADTCSKEYSNERQLKSMKVDWEPLEFTVKEWKGTYILEGEAVELLQTTIDDHLIKSQTMKGSPYIGMFKDETIEWEDFLQSTNDAIEVWVKLQGIYMYLEPVFSSGDIKKQMASDSEKFEQVNRFWRNKLMAETSKNPAAFSVTKIEGLKSGLDNALAKLEEVQKGLNAYLNTKRGLFPRFYFLSNEELLEILSETKDPLRVQPHLKKCFEGIAALEFDAQKIILGMYSAEKEHVEFSKPIDPNACDGNVEQWLKEVEEVMISSVKAATEIANQDYSKRDRNIWVTQHIGMAVLAVSMMFWTFEAEEAMKKGGTSGLELYYNKCKEQLNGLVSVVRTDISKLQRCTLEALVVLDVHARDVIKQDLLDKNCTSANEFAWLSQLRYYWEDNNVWVRIINSVMDYNYEYLGNSSRLVITPLTDRCYRTLCSAIYLNYGGAPEGPAGTGKTETVKDLSKALARQCIVFNCSDGLDYQQMGKFFKGLASCGAWSCFDEFNRIDLEVLSVIAQQLNTIQRAVEKKTEQFEFEGDTIELKMTCNCFITMNPGYAGRSELPDNLKALFRSVAMMVPDYAMIAEIRLYSFGYTDAKDLANKIVTTYKLCSEQLSSQCHYDYGMRAVISVITAAGNLKKKYIDQNESILVLRAINDVNLAKFLAYDLPLFANITSDLFPGIVLPEPDYNDMLVAMKNQIKKLNLQDVQYFIEKTIQLYEMIVVRHGLMVVGMPFAGKTSTMKVLAGALTELNEKGLMDEMKTHMQILNPKSITMGQLYGSFDDVSHDWSDGVLAVWYRKLAAAMDVKDRRWMIFDGPVDAIWIENMNTVLDDNKKLCLMSGEIIQMSANMNMIFEPMDLAVASPATVSRCGMVYMEPDEMGWEPLFRSWKNTLPDMFRTGDPNSEAYLKNIDELVEVMVQPCIEFLRREAQETAPTNNQNIVQALLRIWLTMLKVFEDPSFVESKELDKKGIIKVIDDTFLYSLIWSIACTVTTEYRKMFDQRIKKIANGEIDGLRKFSNKRLLPSAMETRGLVYDYVYFTDTREWKLWTDLTNREDADKFPSGTLVQDIVVTTVDTIRYSYILKHNIEHSIPTLYVGPTGTGKSVYIQRVLLNDLPDDRFLTIECGFSAQTSCNQVQDIVDGKLSRRRTGYFGPRVGYKCVVFVDDLNMPKTEFYGAQPPIEILRQFLDQGGWYDRKDQSFRNLLDTMLIAAMGPPGGGKSFITPRMQRHFNLVAFVSQDDSTMKSIFSNILKWYFRENDFAQEIQSFQEKLVTATLNIYRMIQEDLKPTPLKSHYTFNLRDVSKVICGICLCDKKGIPNTDVAMRLWAHETTRVFGDRLINDEDRQWMLQKIMENIKAPFAANFDLLFKHLDADKNGKVETLDEFRALAFGDIYTGFGLEDRPYEEIDDKKKLQSAADDALLQYNEMGDKPMNLVLFGFAIEHLLRIGRVLKLPGGHALLVGLGGSGRQSLTRLASKVANFEVFQIEIRKNYRMQEFREDLKTLMRTCGGASGSRTTFIFTDNSIKEEAFLEDINNILNTGEVPNIFPPEEKAEVQDSVRKPAKEEGRCLQGTPAQLFSYFIERCKKNLHIVLAFSPIGDDLRNRIRNFPSLVNCTTIDWFSAWPKDALEAVAERFLGEIEMENDVRESCAQMVQIFHTDTEKAAVKFKKYEKRYYYVTPTSYLELITTFRTLLEQKREEVWQLKERYSNGYDCLISTEASVEKMAKELEEKKPILQQTLKEVAEQQIVVDKETAVAEQQKDLVAKDEAIAQEAADAANKIKTDCENELAVAMPVLEKAKAALNKITANDITNLKAMKNPPIAVKVVMKGVCCLLDQKPNRVRNPETQKMDEDYWGPSLKLVSQSGFRDSLLNYPKEDITEKMIKALQPILNDENMTEEKLKSASVVALAVGEWVKAMDKFYEVNLIVKPKLAARDVAVAAYEKESAALAIKQAELKVVIDKVDALNRKLRETLDYKDRLEADVADCTARLETATKLIQGLGGEKTRWKAASEDLTVVFTNLTGDVLISAGMIAYLGAFDSRYRGEMTASWVKNCADREIPNGGEFSLSKVLGDPVQIRSWTLAGLPSDSFSIENAIITDKTRRWPLYIDPQGQANKWIRTMSKEAGVRILKFSNESYLKQLEICIRSGFPCLIENVGQELDPAIEPLLTKSIIKKGGSLTIKIGDAIIDYDPKFKFYMTTKLRNPHYLPEVSTKVTLLNFMITYEGLFDQLLGIVVAKENPDLEAQKEQLVLDGAKNKKKLQETESQILKVLQDSEDILGDAAACEILSSASVISADINRKQKIAKKTEQEIDEARVGYQPIAKKTSGLFFCIQDLAFIDPMYQYSLPFFIDLFIQSIDDAQPSEELEERIDFLNQEFLESLYRNICRSLFEKDKMIFSFLLMVKLKELSGDLDMNEFRFLLTGGAAISENTRPIPAEWLSQKMWDELCRACAFKSMKGYIEHFEKNIKEYEEMQNMTNPEEFKWPQGSHCLNDLRKLIVIRALRPDKLVPAMTKFVVDNASDYFVTPPPFDLPLIYKESKSNTPLIFVLSPGSDPLNALQKFCEDKKKNLATVSLGQGQGPKAESSIAQAQKEGSWVVLQNCHLAVSWMGTLEKICEELSPDPKICHRDFRLWLTSYPSEVFPVAVLQNGIKMTNEAPKGLRSNVSSSFLVDPISNKEWFNGNTQPKKFRKLLFGLCFFHAVIQERRLYGPLGWTIPYQFNEPDLRISVRQLSIFLDEYPDKVPFDALIYLTGECNYGGRVTDKHDRRTLMVLLGDYYSAQMFDDDHKFSPSGIYYAPVHGEYESYIEYAKSLPLYPEPEIFGLHSNAAITKNLGETNNTLEAILSTQQSGGGADEDVDGITNALAEKILEKVPNTFDIESASKKFPVSYDQSMNSVLTQELERYNGLIKMIRSSLKDLQKAIKGEVLLSSELEAAQRSLCDGIIPAMWLKKSFPSLKPLSSYINDLLERLAFFDDWVANGIPRFYWINKFFFTHGFLTGALQNYARSHKFAIDTISMDFEICQDQENPSPPEDGINVKGMYMEGCKWDFENKIMAESDPKILYTQAPFIWFKPTKSSDISLEGKYECPLYKTAERRGVLMTTGHSTNFVLMINFPTEQTQAHWIKRGAAMLCALSE